MMGHNINLGSYTRDLVTIYKRVSEMKGHLEVDGDAVISACPCIASKISDNQSNNMLGDSLMDRWNVVVPESYNGTAITIGVDYVLDLTPEGYAKAIRLKVINYGLYPGIGWEIKADRLMGQ